MHSRRRDDGQDTRCVVVVKQLVYLVELRGQLFGRLDFAAVEVVVYEVVDASSAPASAVPNSVLTEAIAARSLE